MKKKLIHKLLDLPLLAIQMLSAFPAIGKGKHLVSWNPSVQVIPKMEGEIQDSLGLKVISLCWKEGSSETGLTGMKEVAKGYKKAEKVGRAPISPGIDLYICPRSDAIITILAKYGFFKGMAAVEDKPDSMIGCVVWRKNQTSSNSVAKKPESKSNPLSEKPLNSPSLSPLPQAAETEKKLPVTQPALEGAERSVSESKKQTETNNSVAVPEQPKTSLELQKPVIPFSSGKLKEATTFVDDDDLPEFDFRTACGISQTNMTKPPVSVLLDKRLPAEGNRNTDRSVLPGTPNLPAIPVSGQRSDRSKVPSTANAGLRSLKLIADHGPQIPVLPNMGEISSVQNKVTTTPGSTTVFPHPKNIFDDDDDMPEWCPPERSLAETTSRPTTFPSELRNPSFQNLVRGPPRPVPFSPPQSAIRPPFLSQGFPPEAPQPRPLKRGQNSSMGPDSDSILGPAPSFDTKVPFYPAEKRGRRRR
ncbi:hypothetical protein C3L33_05414, partial [Rhododendron williamsianum]